MNQDKKDDQEVAFITSSKDVIELTVSDIISKARAISKNFKIDNIKVVVTKGSIDNIRLEVV